MNSKTNTPAESLHYMADSIAEGLNGFMSNNTIQSSISNLSDDIFTAVDNNTTAISKLTEEVSSLKSELYDIKEELTNLQHLSDIKDFLEMMAMSMYNHYNKK